MGRAQSRRGSLRTTATARHGPFGADQPATRPSRTDAARRSAPRRDSDLRRPDSTENTSQKRMNNFQSMVHRSESEPSVGGPDPDEPTAEGDP